MRQRIQASSSNSSRWIPSAANGIVANTVDVGGTLVVNTNVYGGTIAIDNTFTATTNEVSIGDGTGTVLFTSSFDAWSGSSGWPEVDKNGALIADAIVVGSCIDSQLPTGMVFGVFSIPLPQGFVKDTHSFPAAISFITNQTFIAP